MVQSLTSFNNGCTFKQWSIPNESSNIQGAKIVISHINVIFRFQDFLEIVNDSIPNLQENATKVQRTTNRELRKKDAKGLFLIHQCIDPNIFENIIEQETAKGAWDTLKNAYGGDEKIKKVEFQALWRQYELLQMLEKDSIADYFTKVATLTNQITTNGETLSDQMHIVKIMRTLTSNFEYSGCNRRIKGSISDEY